MTNTYDTSNEPLGSTAVKVLYNNASNLDDAVNSTSYTWVDRPPFGRIRRTWWGMEQDFNTFLQSTAYENPPLVYVDGTPLQVDRPTQLISRGGILYSVKLPAMFPVNLTGTWATDQNLLVVRGDQSLRQDLASLDPTLGGKIVGFTRSELTRRITTASDSLSGQFCNVWEFAHLCGGYVADGDPTTWDWRPAIQAAVNAWKNVYIPPNRGINYRCAGEVTLNDGNMIAMCPSAVIQQTTINTTTFKAIQKNNVWLNLNGGMIRGEGSWSNAWTGMGGHNDRAIQLWGCTNSGVTTARIQNCASAGIAIFGGSNITLNQVVIEGTHLYSAPIPYLGNFQAGLYLRDETTYGILDNLKVTGIDISGVAQGVLSELYSAASIVSRAHSIHGAVIHDIPGQHAFYIQGGALNCDGAVITNTALAGVKIQSADSNAAIRSFSALGITANGIGSNLFEMNCTGTGSVNGVLLSGTVDGCQVGLACNGTIRDLKCDLVATNVSSNAVLIQGDGAKDLDIDVVAQTVGDEGILVTATNATGIRIRPQLRECNQNNGAGKAGILLQTASGHITLTDPVVTDSTGRMDWGIFNSTLGGTIKVRGSVNISGARDTAVRATGKIVEFPTESNLAGTNGDFTGLQNVSSSGPMRTKAVSNSATNVVLWQRTLEAGKTYLIKAKVTGTLNGNTQRRSTELFACAYLSGGVATLQAAPTTVANAQSGSFTGAISLQSNGGTDMVILVNSGGVATHNWLATVEVTEA